MELGFNRYIVECKLKGNMGNQVYIQSFNRYIVECKCRFSRKILSPWRVLIDT